MGHEMIASLNLSGRRIDLHIDQKQLFVPNAVTRLFAKSIIIEKGDVVFDIGTGVGPLAVWAALEGSSEVHAVDPVDAHCHLAIKNSELHAVLGTTCWFADGDRLASRPV